MRNIKLVGDLGIPLVLDGKLSYEKCENCVAISFLQLPPISFSFSNLNISVVVVVIYLIEFSPVNIVLRQPVGPVVLFDDLVVVVTAHSVL